MCMRTDDVGPRKSAHDKSDCFHFWDYESDKTNHILSLLPNQVVRMGVLPDKFNPFEIVQWITSCMVMRDWGLYS